MVMSSTHVRAVAPIDAYWALMKDDKFAEAGEVIKAHPKDPQCLLEMGFRAPDPESAIPFWIQAVELGNPVAMAYLGRETEDLDLIEQARESYSAWARALAFQFVPAHNGDQLDLHNLDDIGQVMDLYMEAMEARESPRVPAALIDWLQSVPLPDRFVPRVRQIFLVVGCMGSAMGVPLGIIRWVEILLDSEESPESNAEIVRELHRPAVRRTPEAARLLCRFYMKSKLARDLGKAASIMLSMPSKHDGEKVAALALSIIAAADEGKDFFSDDRLRESCMYGRALALGKMGLPAIPVEWDPRGPPHSHPPYGRLLHLDDDDSKAGKKAFNVYCYLVYHELRSSHVDWIDWKLALRVRMYRAWIRSVSAAVCEFLLVSSVMTPRLPRDVALIISRMVWNDREQDIPLWWEKNEYYSPLHPVIATQEEEDHIVALGDSGGQKHIKRMRLA